MTFVVRGEVVRVELYMDVSCFVLFMSSSLGVGCIHCSQ